jgi:hypothetical protein
VENGDAERWVALFRLSRPIALHTMRNVTGPIRLVRSSACGAIFLRMRWKADLPARGVPRGQQKSPHQAGFRMCFGTI